MMAKPAIASDLSTRAWQRMLSGRRLDLLDPSPLDIEIADIAHGLARVARWNGQTNGGHIFRWRSTLLVEAVMREPRRASMSACGSRPAARCAEVRHRRHDLAVQGGARKCHKAVEKRLLSAIHIRWTAAGAGAEVAPTDQGSIGARNISKPRNAGFAERRNVCSEGIRPARGDQGLFDAVERRQGREAVSCAFQGVAR